MRPCVKAKMICWKLGADFNIVHRLSEISVCFPVRHNVLPCTRTRASLYENLCFPVQKTVLPCTS